tara:strand:- start:728 stop:1087 length:360 start_codon:yes stop_codon:yes gene_type:complete
MNKMNNDEQPNLFYIRQSSDPSGKWAAELCFRGNDNIYTSVCINDAQLLNFLRTSADIVSQRGILKLTPEQVDKISEEDLADAINKGLEKHNDSDKLKVLSVSEDTEEDTVTISAILTT